MMQSVSRIWTAFLGVCVVLGSLVPTRAAEPDWHAVLGPSQGTVPKPAAGDVVWRADLAKAFDEARRTGRPLFVTFRCLPCKQCAAFDKDVLEGGPTLTPLLKRFITVRITDATAMDFRIFPVQGYQDLDMSWWGWFLSPDARVYSVFGGKDHVSDATRISEAALVATMKRVLSHHYDPRRTGWNIDGPPPNQAKREPGVHRVSGPKKLPIYDTWLSERPWAKNQSCIHCHQVGDMLNLAKLEKGELDKTRDIYVWPLPENVGVKVERDHGLKVTNVKPGSPAARMGIKPGDVLASAAGRKLFSQTDFRGVLHRGPWEAGKISDVIWLRHGKLMQADLTVSKDWRKSIVEWRKTIYDGVIGATPGFFPLKGPRKGIPRGAMAIRPFIGKRRDTPAYNAGLRSHHVIVAVDGNRGDMFGRSFMFWFRMNHDWGDPVTLTVRDKGKEKTIRYTLPRK